MKYNYIFFNGEDGNTRKRNPDGYYTICTKDLETMDGVHLVSYPLDYACTPTRYLFYLHHYPKINKVLNLPLKKLWYPYYFKNPFPDDKPLCFVVSGTYLPIDYLRYLKRKYPNCKMVRIHRDLIGLWKVQCPQYTPEVNQEIFDLRLTIDELEAKKYGIEHFVEFESKIDVPRSPNYPMSDVFFAGRAKDRLPKLMEIYHRLTAQGLTVSYFLLGVPKSDRKPFPGIEYADRGMQYREMLNRTVNTRCLLEINQEGQVGFTSRFLEAVMYNKKLITDNPAVKNTRFYDPRLIQFLDRAEDVDPSFVLDETDVDYHYHNEFSPVNLIHQIDGLLADRF